MRNLRKLNKSRAGDYSGMAWRELVKLAASRGVYKVGMKKADILAAL